MTGKKPPHKRAELTRPHVDAFRNIIYSDVFREKLIFKNHNEIVSMFTAAAESVVLGSKGLDPVLRRKFKELGDDPIEPLFKVSTKVEDNGDITGHIFMKSWDDMNRICFISFDFERR